METKKISVLLRLCVKLLFFLCFLCVFARAELSVEEIVQRSVQQDEETRRRRLGYEYDLKVVTEKIDRADHVLDTRTSEAIFRPGAEIQYQVMLEEGDAKRLRESQKMMATMKLRKLAPRFSFLLQKEEEIIKGVPCYVVNFIPKPGQPYDSRKEKAINRLAGKFWISKGDFSTVRAEGRLTEPVPVAWIFASVREVNFVYETAPLPNGDRGPARFYLLYDVQALASYRRQKQTSTMENYREASKEALAQPAVPGTRSTPPKRPVLLRHGGKQSRSRR